MENVRGRANQIQNLLHAVLMLHSTEQLAYKRSALSMLTTNESITFFDAFKDCDTKRICVTFHELPKYDLDPV